MRSYLTTLAALALAMPLAATAASNDESFLEEIIVTAAKRADSLQDTAISITAITGEQIDEQGRNDIRDILKDMPGITLTNQVRGDTAINMRGITGSSLPNFDASPGVSLSIDGTYNSTLVGGPNQTAFYDVARVEVLRGPQGTLYGRNAEAGAVNIITANPQREFDGAASVEAGNYSLGRFSGMVNVPVGEKFAFRAAASKVERDGFYTSGANDVDTSSGRLKLLFDASENFNVLVGTEYADIRGTVGIGGMGDGVVAWGLGDPPTDPYDDVTKNGGVSGRIPGTWKHNTVRKYWTELNWNTNLGTLTVLPAHVKLATRELRFGVNMDAAMNPIPFSYFDQPSYGKGTQDAVEARFAAPADARVQWVVGAFYLDSFNNTTSTQFGLSTVRVWEKSKAVFAQATLPMGDSWRAIAGVRQNEDVKSFTSTNATSAGLGLPGRGEQTADRFDWKVGLEKDFGEDSMAYLTVATGYRPPSAATGSSEVIRCFDTLPLNSPASAGTPCPNPNLYTKAEELTTFEIGSKNEFLDNRLRVNGAIYHYDYKNRQYSFFTTRANAALPCPSSGQKVQAFGADIVCLVPLNANKVKIDGAEVEALFAPTANDTLGLSVALINAQGAENQNIVVQGPTNAPNPPAIAEQTFNINGRSMPNAPHTQLYGYYERGFTVGNGGRITARVDARHTGKQYLQAFQYLTEGVNAAGFREGDKYVQEAYQVIDFSLGYRAPDDRWSLNLYSKNMDDQIYKTSVDGTTTAVGTPRTSGIVFNFNF